MTEESFATARVTCPPPAFQSSFSLFDALPLLLAEGQVINHLPHRGAVGVPVNFGCHVGEAPGRKGAVGKEENS